MFITWACRTFYTVWHNTRCASEPVPARTAFDSKVWAVPLLLPNLILYDVGETPEKVRYRLVGTEITRRWGFDPTGQSYAEIVGGDDAIGSAQTVLRIAHSGEGARMVRRQQRRSGALEDIEICLLPLWDDRRGTYIAASASSPLAPVQRYLDAASDPVFERFLLERQFFDPDAAETGCPKN